MGSTKKQISKTEDGWLGQQTEIIQMETYTHKRVCVKYEVGSENQNRVSKNRD